MGIWKVIHVGVVPTLTEFVCVSRVVGVFPLVAYSAAVAFPVVVALM